MQRNRKFLCAVLACLAVMAVFPLQAFAVNPTTPIEPEKRCSLTVDYNYESMPIPGAEFQIYHLATVSPNVHFTKTGQFAGYSSISMEGNTVESWNSMAVTVKGYAQADQLEPMYEKVTDGNGKFTISDMATGLYLVVGIRRTVGDYTYIAEPTIVCLPGTDAEGSQWHYDVTVSPKKSRDANPSGDDPADKKLTRKMLVIWDDAGYTGKRPDSVVVKLLKDGKEYDTKILKKEDNWRCAWDNLPAYDENNTKIEWTVIQQAVPNYTLTISRAGITFTATNKYRPPVSPSPYHPYYPYSGGSSYLPQTGVLWWPVPVLLCAGMLCLIVGFYVRRRAEN